MCAGLPTFKQLLSRVKGVVLSALANSELPFSQVLSALSQDQEGLEESSVLQTAFNVELSESAASGPIERIAVSPFSISLEALICIAIGDVSVQTAFQCGAEQVSSHRPCRMLCGKHLSCSLLQIQNEEPPSHCICPGRLALRTSVPV